MCVRVFFSSSILHAISSLAVRAGRETITDCATRERKAGQSSTTADEAGKPTQGTTNTYNEQYRPTTEVLQ